MGCYGVQWGCWEGLTVWQDAKGGKEGLEAQGLSGGGVTRWVDHWAQWREVLWQELGVEE